MTRNRRLNFFLKLSVGLLVVAFLIWKIGLSKILIHFTQFKPPCVLFVILIHPITFIIAGIGVIILGRSISGNLKWLEGMKGFLATVSLSIFMPGRIGDLSLPFYWKDFMSYGESLSVLLMDKIITITWVLGLGSGAVYTILNKSLGIAIGFGSLSALAFFLLLFSMEKSRALFYKLLPQKVIDFFQGFVNAFSLVIRRGKKALLITFFITGLRMSLYGILFWILLLGLDIRCPFYYPILILAIAQLVSILPISIMGIGTVEAVCIFGFSKINVDASAVIAVSLLGRVITLFWLGLFFSLFGIKTRRPRV